MRMEMSFPGGLAVDAQYKGHTIQTDQPEASGGRGKAPSPFDLFLASIGTCAGFYALRFCQQRELPTEGLRVALETVKDEGRVATVRLAVELPEAFPDKYRSAIVRAIDQCTVKKHIIEPPEFEVDSTRAKPTTRSWQSCVATGSTTAPTNSRTCPRHCCGASFTISPPTSCFRVRPTSTASRSSAPMAPTTPARSSRLQPPTTETPSI